MKRPVSAVLASTAALAGPVALLVACGTSSPGGGSAASPASTPGSATATTSGSTASAAPATSASTGVTICATSALKAAVNTVRGSAAAGSVYYPLVLSNISGSSCTLFGYPGVSFVTGPSGGQLGRAATRDPVVPAATVTLAPGQAAHATLKVAQAGNYDPAQCRPVTAHWLKIFPPDQTAALYARFTTQACSARLPAGIGSQLSVSVFQPGAG